MDPRQFEQAVLHMVYAGGQRRLTAQSVAYQLGLSVKAAESMMDRMTAEGTLELDSDDDGNLYYYVPGAGDGPGWNPTSPPPAQGHAQMPGGAPHGQAGTPPWPGPPNMPSQGPPHAGQGGPPAGWPGHGAPPPQGWGGQPQGGWPPQGQPVAWVNQSGPPQNSPGMGGNGYANHPHQAPGAMVPYGHPAPEVHRDPTTAGLLSFVPGAGQLYNGQVFKAFSLFLGTMVLYGAAFPLALMLHGYSAVDAVVTSRRQRDLKMLPR